MNTQKHYRPVACLAILFTMLFLATTPPGQCAGQTWPAAFGLFEQNGPPFGDEPLYAGLAIPCVYVAGDESPCIGMVLKQDENGAFHYDETLTWPAPCTPAAAFSMPRFDPDTGVLTVPVLMFGGKLFWAKIDGFHRPGLGAIPRAIDEEAAPVDAGTSPGRKAVLATARHPQWTTPCSDPSGAFIACLSTGVQWRWMMDDVASPYYQTELGSLYYGDCLQILPDLGPVDMIVADPPYSSGGLFRGDRAKPVAKKYFKNSADGNNDLFSGDNKDQRAYLAWSALWMGAAFKIANPGSICLVFTDWRQLPITTDAVQCAGWIWRNIVTWWKPGIRMQKGRFSASAEYVIYATKGRPNGGGQSLQNVVSIPPVTGKEKFHPAEKPKDLIRFLTGIVPRNGIVLDPFLGGGTTAVVCEKVGLRWLAVECDERWCKVSARNIESARKAR